MIEAEPKTSVEVIGEIQAQALLLYSLFESIPQQRAERAIATNNLDQAIMWAIRGLTSV